MELEHFLLFASENEEERAQANQEFNESIEDPDFIQALFGYIESAASNETLLKLVLLATKRVIIRQWSQDNTFWDYDAQVAIFQRIVELSLALPPALRDVLQDCFLRMVTESDYNIIELIAPLCEELASKTEAHDIYTILRIFQDWASKCFYQPLTDEQKEQYEGPIEELNTAIVQAFITVTQTISQDLNVPYALKILRTITKSISYFSRKSVAMFSDESIDGIIEVMIQALQLESKEAEVVKLKRSIVNLFIQLSKSFLGEIPENDEEEEAEKTESEEVRSAYAVHYKDEILPSLVEAVTFVLSHDDDNTLLARTLFLLSILLFHAIITTEEVNEEFITGVLMPAARLTQENLEEIESNPTGYFGWNLAYSSSVITRRRACANIVKALVKKYEVLDELYDLLLAPTVDPIDFEGRIYLMTAFIKFTLSKYGPMIESEVVDALCEEAAKTDTQQPFVIASLLMLMRYTLPYSDPDKGAQLAAHCILNSDNAAVIIAASKLLRYSVEESETAPEITESVPDVLRKLLSVSSEILSVPVRNSVLSVMKVGGESSIPLAKEVIGEMLQFCDEEPVVNSETGKVEEDTSTISASITSVASILGALKEHQEVLVEIAAEVLPRIAQYFTTRPQTLVYDEILYLLSVIFTNLEAPVDFAYGISAQFLEIIANDEILLSHTEQISCTFCPLIVKPGDGAEAERVAFNDQCILACTNMIHYCDEHPESTSSDKAYALLMASCLIQWCGEPGLIFTQNAIEGIVSADEPILFSAAIHVITAAFMCNAEDTMSKLNPSVIEHIATSINAKNLPTYKEFKLGFALQLMLCRAGRKPSYRGAVELLNKLAQLKTEDEIETDDPAFNSSQASLILPFELPIYSLDEFQLFNEVTNETGLYNALSSGNKKIVKKYFQM